MHLLRTTRYIYSILLCATTIQPSPLKKIKAFFGATPFEQIIEKDYKINTEGTIIIKNVQGTIKIKTGLDKQSVAVRATKYASVQEDLDHMHVLEEEVSQDVLALRTTYGYDRIKGHVDYVLTLPEDAHVQVFNDHADVCIEDVQGTVLVNIGNGNCTLYTPAQKSEVNITQKGDITIIKPTDLMQLSTNKGIIRVIDSSASIAARAKKGKIEVKCKSLPENGSIKLATHEGSITVHTPQTLNCSINAETESGIVTSTQEVTLDPMTVTLDENFWQKIKRTVKGWIGTAEPIADIKLFSKSGDIKILKY